MLSILEALVNYLWGLFVHFHNTAVQGVHFAIAFGVALWLSNLAIGWLL